MRLRYASVLVVLVLAIGWSAPAYLGAQGNNNRRVIAAAIIGNAKSEV